MAVGRAAVDFPRMKLRPDLFKRATTHDDFIPLFPLNIMVFPGEEYGKQEMDSRIKRISVFRVSH